MSAKSSARAFTLRRLRDENMELARKYRFDIDTLKEHIYYARRANRTLVQEFKRASQAGTGGPEGDAVAARANSA
jgi:hypothetical protein